MLEGGSGLVMPLSFAHCTLTVCKRREAVVFWFFLLLRRSLFSGSSCQRHDVMVGGVGQVYVCMGRGEGKGDFGGGSRFLGI